MYGTEKQIKYANDIKNAIKKRIEQFELEYDMKLNFSEVQNILDTNDSAKEIIEKFKYWKTNFPDDLARMEQRLLCNKKALELYSTDYETLEEKDWHKRNEVIKNVSFYRDFCKDYDNAWKKKIKK